MNNRITPKITREVVEEAKRNPGGWVYAIDSRYERDGDVPADKIVGYWKVNEHGVISGEFTFNAKYVE